MGLTLWSGSDDMGPTLFYFSIVKRFIGNTIYINIGVRIEGGKGATPPPPSNFTILHYSGNKSPMIRAKNYMI